MAFDYKRLTEITTISTSGGTPIVYEVGSSVTKAYIKNVIIHNTYDYDLPVSLYIVPNAPSATGTLSDSNKFYRETLQTNDTTILEFPAPGIVLEDVYDTVQAIAPSAGLATIQIYGAEE